LGSLGVADSKVPSHLAEGDRALRRGLRAKSRQLGDLEGVIDLLAAECAFEQWHRLLFARFLADNGLLIHPEFGAAVTLPDCDELADELGEPDGWAVAGRFAAQILPGIFRLDDPCVQLRLAPEGRQELERIIAGLPPEVFTADDALGWVYQFWQKEKKDEVNASERKIGGADLGPVTQLFTETYMVRFLLENSLGAWWASRHPDSSLIKDWDYLRLDDSGVPASGSFDGWPERVADVTVMDPCCGSGHFLVETFGMLWRMRAEEEGLGAVAAQDAVLRDNLFGLELDPRCVQIAMFAVALATWKAGGGWRELPVPHVACSGIPIKAPVEEWKALAGGDSQLEGALVRLHILFRDADTLGSLIDPKRAVEISHQTGLQRSLDDVKWDEVAPLLVAVLTRETGDPATAVLGADAAGIARAADYLTRKYTLVVTNPPWLQRTRQTAELQDFGDRDHPDCVGELALMFLRRCRVMNAEGGHVAQVTPQQWLEVFSYIAFRSTTLASRSPEWVVALGAQAFSSPMHPGNRTALYLETISGGSGSLCSFIQLAAATRFADKPSGLKAVKPVVLSMAEIQANPEHRIVPISLGGAELLSEYAYSYAGVQSHDSQRFIRRFWEILDWDAGGWVKLQSNVNVGALFAGRENLYRWEQGAGALARLQTEHPSYMKSLYFRGDKAWSRRGIAIGQMYQLEGTIYTGEAFDNNTAVLIPNNDADLLAIWCFCASGELNRLVRMIDSKMGVTNATLTKVPFDAARWRDVAQEQLPDGLPEPWSDDPTQWLFEGRPEVATESLQVAVGRLLGYRWPEQAESDVLDELADDDGIVCLSSVLGERTAADRLQELLSRAFGGTWSPARMRQLLEASGSKKKDLESWLRDDFFKAHCQAFKNRPFVWQIWDGRKDGFSALVNYHRLDRPTLERLTYTYLGDWIERQTAGVRDDAAGAEERLAAAQELQRSLGLILRGEPPFDIFVRWKDLADQPMSWDPDLNDGVRLNVRPFVEAGVLRAKFNVKWEKDRGKNPKGTERHNNIHHTLDQKQAARTGSTS